MAFGHIQYYTAADLLVLINIFQTIKLFNNVLVMIIFQVMIFCQTNNFPRGIIVKRNQAW